MRTTSNEIAARSKAPLAMTVLALLLLVSLLYAEKPMKNAVESSSPTVISGDPYYQICGYFGVSTTQMEGWRANGIGIGEAIKILLLAKAAKVSPDEVARRRLTPVPFAELAERYRVHYSSISKEALKIRKNLDSGKFKGLIPPATSYTPALISTESFKKIEPYKKGEHRE